MNTKTARLLSASRQFLTPHATRHTRPDSLANGRTIFSSPRFNASTVQRFNALSGFSLIELLVVIAVIGILAALFLGVGNIVTLKSHIQAAESEEKALETAIETYHAKFGFYPPSNGNSSPTWALTNQLYYELIGTTNNPAALTFTTIDDSSTILVKDISAYYHVFGFMNCTKGSSEDAHPAQTFLSGLKPGQIGTNMDGVCAITTAVASDPIYQPMLGYNTRAGRPANPWRYLYPGVNNPNSYDLWIQIFIGGKTNLICNWKTTPQINSPLP